MKISIYIATATNGLISNARNVPDWLSQDYGEGLYSFCTKSKAVIMGRKTYDILTPHHLPLKTEGTTVVITSNKQAGSDNPTVVFTQTGPSEIVQMLTEKGHTEAVIIGGATVISEFVNAGVVNDIYLVIEPVLFGNGLPLLKEVDIETKMKLIDVVQLNENTVRLHYELLNN